MKLSLLQIIHRASLKRAINLNYPGNFPNTLNSITSISSNTEEIKRDYTQIAHHFKHPIFKNWIPTYDESIKCQYLVWLKRASISYKSPNLK